MAAGAQLAQVVTPVYTYYWTAYQTLLERGYHPDFTMVRMKRGKQEDYEDAADLVVVVAGAVKSSANVKTTTTKSRIDFDLKPEVTKKVKHYVWVDAKTGTHMGSGWVEVNDAGGNEPGASNVQTASGELAREMQRRNANPTGHP